MCLPDEPLPPPPRAVQGTRNFTCLPSGVLGPSLLLVNFTGHTEDQVELTGERRRRGPVRPSLCLAAALSITMAGLPTGEGYFTSPTHAEFDVHDAGSGELLGAINLNTTVPRSVFLDPAAPAGQLADARFKVRRHRAAQFERWCSPLDGYDHMTTTAPAILLSAHHLWQASRGQLLCEKHHKQRHRPRVLRPGTL